jgi:branched-chain amino acid transport system substrate-binding protein
MSQLRRIGITRRHALAAMGAAVAAPSLPARAQATVVRVGHIQALTGPSGAYGIRGRDGAQMALEEVNAAGGVPLANGGRATIEMSVDDMANDARQAITLFRQRAADAATLAVLGPINSVGFIPLIPVANELRMPLIGNGSLAPVRAWNPWAYRANTISAVATPILIRGVVRKENVKRLAVIYDQTQDNQVGDAGLCRSLARELGYEVVAFEAFRTGDQDFSPQIATIRQARPDAIFVAAATGDGVRVVSQIREFGLRQKLLTGSGSFQDPVFWDGTRGAIVGDFTWLAQDLETPAPPLRSFMERYNARFSQAATLFSINGHDSVHVFAEALKRAGAPDRARLQAELAKLSMTTPLGSDIGFENPPSGDNARGKAVVVQITGRGTYTRVA